MPLVRIEIEKGKSPEYKKAILDGVHQALVETIKIPDHDRRQRLYELDAESFEHSCRIVDLLGGNLGIPRNDITIVLNDPPLENWGIRGGYPASEVDLEFDIKV
jgi:phenylpyruvate tautomerase PptA (4-oxalocrotonate tautomerase family)